MATRRWTNGNSTGVANDALNWDDGAGSPGAIPVSGDDVQFTSYNTDDCDWNINPIGLGSFTITSGYTGVITVNNNDYISSAGAVTIAAGKTIKFKNGASLIAYTLDISGASGSRTTLQSNTVNDYWTLKEYSSNSQTWDIDYCDIEGCDVIFNCSIDRTATFDNCNFEIYRYFRVYNYEHTITLTNCVLDNFASGTLWYFDYNKPEAIIKFVNTSCKNFQPSIHYRTTGSGNYMERLHLQDGIQIFNDRSSSQIVTNMIAGSATPRKVYRGGNKRYEMGIIPINYTPDGTLRAIAERGDTVAISTYREFISKCLITTPLIRYNYADEREIRWTVEETL